MDGNFPLSLQNERCSGTADVGECSGIENHDATRKSPENNECSGVAEFGAGTGDDKPAEPWGEFSMSAVARELIATVHSAGRQFSDC